MRAVLGQLAEWRARSGAERRSASARAARARIVKAEAAGVQALDVVERDACDIRQRDFVHENFRAVDLAHYVAFLVPIEAQRVLKAGASAADHRDAQSLVRAQALLGVHLLYHLERAGRQDDGGTIGRRAAVGGVDALLMLVLIADFFRHYRKILRDECAPSSAYQSVKFYLSGRNRGKHLLNRICAHRDSARESARRMGKARLMDARGLVDDAELVAAPEILAAPRIAVERIHAEAPVAVSGRLDADDAVADASGGDHDSVSLVGLGRAVRRAGIAHRGKQVAVAGRYRRNRRRACIAEKPAAGEASQVNSRVGVARDVEVHNRVARRTPKPDTVGRAGGHGYVVQNRPADLVKLDTRKTQRGIHADAVEVRAYAGPIDHDTFARTVVHDQAGAVGRRTVETNSHAVALRDHVGEGHAGCVDLDSGGESADGRRRPLRPRDRHVVRARRHPYRS